MKKRILITGASGFIGYHLAHTLCLRGDYVIGLDNYNDYYNPQLKHDRSVSLREKGIEIIHGDVCDEDQLNAIVEKHGITHIAHLAAQAGVRYSLQNPKAYVKANIEGFLSILETCRKHPSIKLTYASSSSVYGLNGKTPFSTQDRTDQQASFYGNTKKANELMAQTYHHLYQIPVTGLRFFTVYGPWGRPDMAYFSFTDAILSGKPIDIFNNGQMLRDFTYIDDIIDGTVAAIDLESSCEIFNLGNHQPIPLLDFIHVLEQAIGKKANKRFSPMQQGDVLATYAEIEASRTKLGFSPRINIEVGIPRFIEWYKNYFKV